MSSFSSSRIHPLPYDPVRSAHVDEAATRHPSPFRFNTPGSDVSEPYGATLWKILEDAFTERAIPQAMMAQMDWLARPTLSPITYSQAEIEILERNAVAYARNRTRGHFEENIPQYPGDDIYGNNIDPRLNQENVPHNYARNYTHGHFEENVPHYPGINPSRDQEYASDYARNYTHGHFEENIPHYPGIDPSHGRENAPDYARNYTRGRFGENISYYPGDDVYDNGVSPFHEQENIPPNYAGNYPYGNIVIPRQIAPLQESLLNSTPIVFPPSIQREINHPQEPVYNAYPFSRDQSGPPPDATFPPSLIAENHYPVTESRHHSERAQRKRVWEDDDDESFHASRPQKIARSESPEIKTEPVEDEDYYSSYQGIHSSYHGPRPQEPEIRESIERDPTEEYYVRGTIEHMKREPAEDPYPSSPLATST
ncbi:hypothetical protein F5B21DRAFT_507583 [Xylaria acuta]|nr:hypothetical protein F5B21DRAFT_507583 [Xylaria acuta]